MTTDKAVVPVRMTGYWNYDGVTTQSMSSLSNPIGISLCKESGVDVNGAALLGVGIYILYTFKIVHVHEKNTGSLEMLKRKIVWFDVQLFTSQSADLVNQYG